jgi:hypothetical protein
MLSLSAEASQTDIDLQIVNGAEDANGSSGGVEFSNQLMKFAEAVASRDETALTSARADLLRVGGNDVLVDAAGVAGNFQRMVRIADSTGIPVDDRMGALSGSIPDDLNLRRFGSAQNTPSRSALKKMLNVPKGFLMRKLLGYMGSR